MSFDDEKILQDYIARLLTMQDKRDEWLGEQDLKTVARDLGLSGADLKRLDAVTEAHRQRGKNFARHGAWDEAIAEFRQATVLDPAHARGPEAVGRVAHADGAHVGLRP